MAKSFKKSNPLDNIDTTEATEPTPVNETPVAAVEPPKAKGKVGRPKTKTEPTKTINIAVPVSVLEQMEIAKLKYGDNLTKYVNEVIAKDLEANMDAYRQIYDLLKQ